MDRRCVRYCRTMSGIPFNGLVSSAEDLCDAIATGIAERRFYIAGRNELRYLWPASSAGGSDRLRVLESFASENGWNVTTRWNLAGALFQTLGREVLSPAIWRASAAAR